MDQTRSWEWQIRDSKGRWIEMGAQVSFMANGASVSGKVIGSPKPGMIVIQTADGKQISIPSSAVTVTAPGAPQDLASPTKKAPEAPEAATAPKRAKAVLHGGTEALSAAKDPETDAPTDRRLRGVHAVSSQIERALRVAAKEQGLPNPFASEKKPAEKRQTPAERKVAEKKSAEKAAEKAKEEADKTPAKKQVDHRKKLTQSQIDAVSEILKKVLVDVRAGQFSGAKSRLDAAEKILKNTSAPWLSKRISYLKKGLAGFSLTAAGTAAHPLSGFAAISKVTPKPRPNAYKPKPWLWQLRDRIGRWIEMHSEVTWSASGQTKRGIVTGSPKEGVATVKEAKTGREVRLHTSRLTSVFALPYGNMHSEADNPSELIIHTRKATKIHLDVPTPEPVVPPSAAPIPVVPKDLSTLSDTQLRDLYWALRDHPKVKMTSWMRVAIAIVARHIEVDPHSGGYLPAGTLASGGGNSWQWQLRDAEGQWIEMGARVRWFDRGTEFAGTVVGSPQQGTAYIKVNGDDVNNGVHAVETSRISLTGEAPVPDAIEVTADAPPDDYSLDYSYRLDSMDIRLLQEKADKINKRAQKRGLTGEVSILSTPTDNPNIFEVKIVGSPKLPGGWTLSAVIDGSGQDAIVNRNPRDPVKPEIARDKAGDCDYCKTARDRVKTYVLRDDGSGTIKYVGSSCLSDFLGHQVSVGGNPWGSEDEFDGLAGFASGMSKTRTEDALYYAAVMIGSYGFVKTSEPGSTRDMVQEILNKGERKFEQDLERFRRPPLKYPEPEAWTKEQAEILDWMRAGETMWDNDYRRNLAAVAHRGAVDWKTMGLVVSAVSSYRREQDRERERAARAKATRAEVLNELLAPVGTKVVKVPVKIISTSEHESQWGWSTRVVMMDDKGHRIVWWASNFPPGFEPGDEVLMNATVKKSDEFRGVFSTVVLRAKLTPKAVTASAWEGDGLMPLAAAGDSWRWQLRDKDGQWIRMGSRVSWAANGMIHVGEVVGSPKDGTALVREARDGSTHHMPSKRLTALPTVGDRVRHTGGGKAAKASLAEVIDIPKQGRVTIRHLLTGKEEIVAEKTLAVLQLDRMRELVREQGGASVKIDGTEPSTGYMVAQLDGGMVVPATDFYGPDGAKYLFDFMRANAKRFKDNPDTYIGLWYDEDAEPPRVTLDVAHNVQDRNDAILFGQYQNQRKIWDVVKMEEIDTGGTGGYADGTEADGVRPADQGRGRDVGRGTDGVVPAGGYEDRHWIRRPPPLGGLRVADARSSMASFGPQEWAFINNGGGSLADPEHIKTGRGALTAAPSDMVDHYTDVLRNALNGIPEAEGVDPATLEHAHLWYEGANEVCANMLKEFTAKYPQSGLTMEKITGVMAAMSPRMKWAQNIESCRRVIEAECSGRLDGIPMEQAKTMTKAGCYDYVEDALYILRGSTEMTGLKRKSFWNCMLDPSNTWDVCMDGWMASATRRAGLTHLDGSPLEESTLSWLDHGLDNADTDLVEGAGYVVLADALRIAAARVGLTPLQAQALYWVSVGGGVEDKVVVMWTDERRARGTSPKALRKAELERQHRLDAALSPVEVAP